MIKSSASNIFKAVKSAIETDMIPIVVGAAGIGKTQGITQMVKKQNWNLVTINLSNVSYGELSIQRPHPTKPATIDIPHILIQEAVKKALAEPDKITVLFGDEANRSEDSRCTNSLMQFLQSRKLPGLSSIKINRLTEAGREFLKNGGKEKELVRGEHYNIVSTKNDKLPDNVRFVLAINPSSDMPSYENSNYQTNDMDKAQISRGVIMALEPNLKDWVEWASDTNPETKKPYIHPIITEFVSENRSLFFVEDDEQFITPNPRSWEMVSNAYEAFLKDKEEFTFQILAAGAVGRDSSTTLLSFIREADNPMIKANQVFNKKLKNVPEKILEKLKGESFARQLMTIKSFLAYFDEKIEDRKFAQVKDDMPLLIEIINNLPDDMMVSVMARIEHQHPKIHSRAWLIEEYVTSFTSRLSRFDM